MTKLVIFDKDGTLVEPISGGTFVQHPHDQRLRPGVAEKLEQLRGDGLMMAIASNQDGCSIFEVLAEDIKPGMAIDLDGEWAKVLEVETTIRYTRLFTDTGLHTISGLFDARYKSIDDACDEMEFAMKLIEPYLHYETLSQFRGIFCPDMDGKAAHVIQARSPQGEYRRSIALEYPDWPPSEVGSYRKPAPGMLIDAEQWLRWSNIKVTERLMVGDRAEDQAAAEAAGFSFAWAVDYFGGDNA